MSGHGDGSTKAGALQREAGMMKLERLIAERETVEIEPLSIATKELLARYERLYTGAISATCFASSACSSRLCRAI